MRTALWRFGCVLPVGSLMMTLAACGSTPSPTAAQAVPATRTAATAGTVQEPTASGVIRGLVVDASNRPLANAQVECASNAQCRRFADVSAQDGPDDGVRTDAKGSYEMIVTRSGGGPFLLNASARGYGVVWQQVELPDPACSWDRASCAITANFRLSVAAE